VELFRFKKKSPFSILSGVISALGRPKQEDFDSEASLGYISENLSQKN
jgi:hypothetical protein